MDDPRAAFHARLRGESLPALAHDLKTSRARGGLPASLPYTLLRQGRRHCSRIRQDREGPPRYVSPGRDAIMQPPAPGARLILAPSNTAEPTGESASS